MSLLAKKRNVIFLGQSVIYPGNLIYKSLDHISNSKKIETPVFEETQLGMSIGLSLNGFLPICCYPRFDFFILAMNQAVNHLDKLNIISNGLFKPKVIVRILVGNKKPLNAGEQHTQNHSKALKSMIKNCNIFEINRANQVIPFYKKAIMSSRSSFMIEKSV